MTEEEAATPTPQTQPTTHSPTTHPNTRSATITHMDNDYRQRLRDAYADRVLDDLNDIASRSDSEYTRFHALKLLGQHHGLDHVLHQLMNLSHHAKSDWVRLQIASLVGHHLQLFTPFNKHRNAPPSLITLPEPNEPSHKLPPTVEHAIRTGAPFPDEEPLNQPANPHLLNGSRPHPAPEAAAETTTTPTPVSAPPTVAAPPAVPAPTFPSYPRPLTPSYPRPAAGISPPPAPDPRAGSHPQHATTAVAEPFNPWRPFKTNEAANTPTIAAIAQALQLAKSTTHPPDP